MSFYLVVQQTTVEEKNPIKGTWELVSYQNQYPDTTILGPKDYARQIKIINKTHFVWISQDTSRVDIYGFGGGKYILDGDNYTEHIEMFIVPSWIGNSIPYNIKIEGDTLILGGTVPLKKFWGRI